MTTAAAVLATAASQIGITENPPGSNIQKYGAYFGANGQPWCAWFDAWCFAQNNINQRSYLGLLEIGYCPALVNAYKAKGQWYPVSQAQPGDQVFYCWDGSGVAEHTGIVQELIAGPQIVSIEGNTSLGNDSNGGEVMRRVRDPHYALGVGRPPYTPEDTDVLTPLEAQQITNTNAAVGRLEVAIEDPTTGLRTEVANLTALVQRLVLHVGA